MGIRKQTVCQHCFGTGYEVDQIEVSGRLRATREASGLEASAVAEAMGISRGYICDLEYGRRLWTKDLRDKYAESILKLELKKGTK